MGGCLAKPGARIEKSRVTPLRGLIAFHWDRRKTIIVIPRLPSC